MLDYKSLFILSIKKSHFVVVVGSKKPGSFVVSLSLFLFVFVSSTFLTPLSSVYISTKPFVICFNTSQNSSTVHISTLSQNYQIHLRSFPHFFCSQYHHHNSTIVVQHTPPRNQSKNTKSFAVPSLPFFVVVVRGFREYRLFLIFLRSVGKASLILYVMA